MEKILKKIYFDPAHPAGFSGVRTLFKAAKAINPNITIDFVTAWINDQEVYGLHKPLRHRFKRSRLISSGLYAQNDVDLADVSNLAKDNDKVRFLLISIDTFSRKLYVQPLLSKKGVDVRKGFENLWGSDPWPKLVRSDNGGEFKNAEVQKFFKTNSIYHFTTSNEVKAHLAERVIRTLRGRLQRYITANQNERYIDVLQKLVTAYNNAEHSSIGVAPSSVTKENERAVWWMQYWPKAHRKTPKAFLYDIGNNVRISYSRHAFTRGYDYTFSGEVFKVIRRSRRDSLPIYTLEDLAGEKLTGTFYTEELTLAPRDSLWRIEKVLKKRKRKGQKESFVKWLHFGNKFNSWIPARDIVDT